MLEQPFENMLSIPFMYSSTLALGTYACIVPAKPPPWTLTAPSPLRIDSEIAIAAFIDNVNLRGRIIEYLITAEDDLKATLMNCLHTRQPLPEIFTADKLGDYEREFEHYLTETDIKTKVLFLSSNPKGYNIDKLLSFLSEEKSVYLVFVVAIDEDRTIQTRLCSMFNRQLLSGTRIIKHWAGRNSRGVTQYEGRVLEAIVEDFDSGIDYDASQDMITDFLRG